MSDSLSAFNCDWCGKYSLNKYKHIKIVDDVEYSLCGTCNSFPTKELMESGLTCVLKLAMIPGYGLWGYPWAW